MDNLTVEDIQGFAKLDGGILRTIGLQYLELQRDNERLREFVEQVANPPELMPHGLNENDQCIVCGFSHKLMAEHAKKALNPSKTSVNNE